MLSQLLRQLISSFGIFFRTIKAFFTRRLMSVAAYFRRITNFSRQATKVANASFQGAAAAVKKPTKREDYIETQRLFISKSFLILAAIALVVFGLFMYYIGWPFILSHFLTARFYQEDERIPEWTGKVIVYYDKKKTIPKYSGKLEEGILQGQGKEYDEEGLLTYEGGFVDGVRSGSGIGYVSGVLLYEGQFENGVYEGTGTLYEDGMKSYQGAFSEGLPNGMGTAYKEGTKRYEGGFVDGVYEGQGSAYDENGTLRYTGSFDDGLYDGEGSAYDEEGDLRYKGSFGEGLYDGPGTVYLKNGDRISSEFSKGVGNGVIQWYKNGRLWYDGGADDLTPDGFGRIYTPNGKTIYAGEMDRGTLDGGWMLTLTAEELREAFGDANVTESGRNAGGFLTINNDMGLTVLCTFRQGEEDAHAYRIWFAPDESSDIASLMPWANRMASESWAGKDRDDMVRNTRSRGRVFLPQGSTGGDWNQSVFYYEDHALSMVYARKMAAPFEVIWAQSGGLDLKVGTDAADETAAQAQEQLDALLDALEGVGGGGGSGGGEGGGEADPADVERLLGLMLTPQDAYDLMNALTDYYAYGKTVEAMEASRPLLEQNLSEQQRLLDQGREVQDAVDAVQDSLDSLDSTVLQYRVVQEQARLVAEKLTGMKLDGYDLAAVLKVIDVASLDASGLYEAAVDYAKGIAAGRYEVDEAQIELDVKTQILDMTLAYEGITSTQETLDKAKASLEEINQAYATGTAEKSAMYSAQCAVNDAAAALFQTTGAYTKLINRLNDLSGGWVAEQYGWFAEPFGVLYDMARQQSADAAEADKQQPADVPADPGEETPDEENPGEETPGEETSDGENSDSETSGGETQDGAATGGDDTQTSGETTSETEGSEAGTEEPDSGAEEADRETEDPDGETDGGDAPAASGEEE